MKRYWRAAAAALVMAGGLGSVGCVHGEKASLEDRYRNWVDTNWPDRYSYAARQSVLAPFAQQAANGHFLHQTVWNFYFEPGTDKLTAGGMDKLNSLARSTPAPDTKIYIQTARDIVITPENADKVVALRNDLDSRRAAAILRYMSTQPGTSNTYEVYVHDAPVPGMYSEFAGNAFRGQLAGYVGGIAGAGAAPIGVGGGTMSGPPPGTGGNTTVNVQQPTSGSGQ